MLIGFSIRHPISARPSDSIRNMRAVVVVFIVSWCRQVGRRVELELRKIAEDLALKNRIRKRDRRKTWPFSTIPNRCGICRGQKTVSVEAHVGEALSALTQQYPNLRSTCLVKMADCGHRQCNLNDEDVRYLKHVETPLQASDKLHLPSVGVTNVTASAV